MTEPHFFQNSRRDHTHVCFHESEKWTRCLLPLAEYPKSKPVDAKSCLVEKKLFEKCVLEWRVSINDLLDEQQQQQEHKNDDESPSTSIRTNTTLKSREEFEYRQSVERKNDCKVKVRGREGRMLPHQCHQLTHIHLKCMLRSGYEASLCKVFLDGIKRCTQLMYGSEYLGEEVPNTLPASSVRIRS